MTVVEERPCQTRNNLMQACPGERSSADEWRLCPPCRARRAIAGRAVGLAPRRAAEAEDLTFNRT